MLPIKKKSQLLVRSKEANNHSMKMIFRNWSLMDNNINQYIIWTLLINYKCRYYIKNENKLDKYDKNRIKSNKFY